MTIKEILINKIKEESQNQNYKGFIRVSELSLCPTRAYYAYNGIEQSIDDEETILKLEIGSKLHEFLLQHYLSNYATDIEKEVVREYKGYRIIGHVDAIVELDGQKYVVEFKTIADKVYRNKKTTKDYLPTEHHKLQIGLYMISVGIERGKLVYLLKSSGEIVEFDIELDEELIEKVVKVLDETVEFMEKSKENENKAIYDIFMENRDSWKCKYCGYKHICSKASDKAVEEAMGYI